MKRLIPSALPQFEPCLMDALTTTQRLTCLLALLDDVIKKDEERTPGEWKAEVALGISKKHVGDFGAPYDSPFAVCHGDKSVEENERNASFIASASVSHGLNARVLKEEIELAKSAVDLGPFHSDGFYYAQAYIDRTVASYPDEILKRHLKP